MAPQFKSIYTELGGDNMDFVESYPVILTTRNKYLDVEPYIETKVSDPRKITSGTADYTVYKVTTRTNIEHFKPTSTVYRRYNDFRRFRDFVVRKVPVTQHLQLPPKKLRNRFSEDTINERVEGLDTFMKTLATHPVVRSTCGVILRQFLQSTELEADWDI